MSSAARRRPLTQCERVLRALRAAGRRGISQLDFDAPSDGRPPIRRLASRIADLRAAGYRIESNQRRHKMAVYLLLVGSPEAHPPAKTSSQEVPAALLAGEDGRQPQASPFDPWGDWS